MSIVYCCVHIANTVWDNIKILSHISDNEDSRLAKMNKVMKNNNKDETKISQKVSDNGDTRFVILCM